MVAGVNQGVPHLDQSVEALKGLCPGVEPVNADQVGKEWPLRIKGKALEHFPRAAGQSVLGPDVDVRLKRGGAEHVDQRELLEGRAVRFGDLILGTSPSPLSTMASIFSLSLKTRFSARAIPFFATWARANVNLVPFSDLSFDLAVCSHFPFLYSSQFTEAFHEASILELCRVARVKFVFFLCWLWAAVRLPTWKRFRRRSRAAATTYPLSWERGKRQGSRWATAALRTLDRRVSRHPSCSPSKRSLNGGL